MSRICTLRHLMAIAACLLAPLAANAGLTLNSDGLTVYETVNKVNWLADVNLTSTNGFGLPVCNGPGTQVCVNPSGSMRFPSAAAWVAAINAANYLGHPNWQLPTTPITDAGCGKKGPSGNSFGFHCAEYVGGDQGRESCACW